MFYYTDIILSKRPWAFCRLSEPTTSFIYLDQTGNKNHLYTRSEIEDNEAIYPIVASNQEENSIINEISSKSIIIDDGTIRFFNEIKWNELSLLLFFQVPEFRTEYTFYRRGEKVQELITISSLWMETVFFNFAPFLYFTLFNETFSIFHSFEGSSLILDALIVDIEGFHGLAGERFDADLAVGYSFRFFEYLLTLGPIDVFSTTLSRYDHESFPYYQKLYIEFFIDQKSVFELTLKEREWNGVLYIEIEPPLFNETDRFTLGVSQSPHDKSKLILHLSINGMITRHISIDNTINLSNYASYRSIGFSGLLNLSHVSVFFNEPFPNDEWLSTTQEILFYDKDLKQIENKWNRFDRSDYPFSLIENKINSFSNFMDSLLYYGSKHNIVSFYNHTPSVPIVFRLYKDSITPELPEYEINDNININSIGQFFTIGVWFVISIFSNGIFIIPSTTAQSQLIIHNDEDEFLVEDVRCLSGNTVIHLKKPNTFRSREYVIVDYINPKVYLEPHFIEGSEMKLHIHFEDIQFETESFSGSYSYFDFDDFIAKGHNGQYSNIPVEFLISIKNQQHTGEHCWMDVQIDPLSPPYNLWKVLDIGSEDERDYIDIQFIGRHNDFLPNENVIIKKVPLGGARVWNKEMIEDNKSIHTPLYKTEEDTYSLLCDDSLSTENAVFNLLAQNGNKSDDAFFLKYTKNNVTRPFECDFQAIGDPYRFYLFVSSKLPEITHSQILGYGQLAHFLFPNDYETFLMGYESGNILTETNLTFAFEYADWRILNTGHLLCQLNGTERKGTSLVDYETINKEIISDGGMHIFPDNYIYKANMQLPEHISGATSSFKIIEYYDNIDFYALIENISIELDEEIGIVWTGLIEAPDSNEIFFPNYSRLITNMLHIFRIGVRKIPIISIVQNQDLHWLITTEEPHGLSNNSWFERILGSNRGTAYDNLIVPFGGGYFYGNSSRIVLQVISDTSFVTFCNQNDIFDPPPFLYDPDSEYDKMYLTVPTFVIPQGGTQGGTQGITDKNGPDGNGNAVYTVKFEKTGMYDDGSYDIDIRVGQLSTFTYF